jgi:hypothetical protein
MTEQELTALAKRTVEYESHGLYTRAGYIAQGYLDERAKNRELTAERDAATKSAEFQRKRADRGWFLYGRTVTEFLDFKESRPVRESDWDEMREELRVCEAERDALKAQLDESNTILAEDTRGILANTVDRFKAYQSGYERGRDAVFAQVEDITHGNYTADVFRCRFREVEP